MTEAEWLACDDFVAMHTEVLNGDVSARKCTLLDCAAFRQVWNHLPPRRRELVEMLERMADEHGGSISAAMELGINSWRAAEVAAQAGEGFDQQRREQCDLLRDIFGNPFRPVAFDTDWRSSTALAIAQGIYADRAFDPLPILADALQDAECEDADILGHLRGDGAHVRGCWALDLVLGKE